MKIEKKDIKFRYTRGQGPGGQHKNKTDSCVTATHVPTGIEVRVDGRSQHKNKKQATKELLRRLLNRHNEQKADEKKSRREEAIRSNDRVRTYSFKTGVVTDHRTGKTASVKDILGKGMLSKLR